MRIVVIGGGIAGLAAAWFAAERSPNAEVLVIEQGATVGGKLRVAEVAGQPVDVGAEAILARRPEAVDLVHRVGLGDHLIYPQTTAARVYAGRRVHPLPGKTIMGIPSDIGELRGSGLLSDAAIAAVVNEPVAKPLDPLLEDVSVGGLVRNRLGDEVVDRLVDPMVGGVYAGRADGISLRAALPVLADRLRNGGSLVEAAQAVTDIGTHAPGPSPVFAALAGGVGRLPAALASSARFAARTHTVVRSLARTPTGFILETGAVPASKRIVADAVVVATPAAKAAMLLRDVVPIASAELARIETASVAIVTLAYRQVSLPPGSGLLIAAGEPFAVHGITFTSQKWPGSAAGMAVLRASIGRAGGARDLQRDDSELIATVRRELRALIGITAEPIDALVTRWGGGLPQYAVGHVERVARIRPAVANVPRLAVCGATYDGVGIPACIASARLAVDQIVRSPAA